MLQLQPHKPAHSLTGQKRPEQPPDGDGQNCFFWGKDLTALMYNFAIKISQPSCQGPSFEMVLPELLILSSASV